MTPRDIINLALKMSGVLGVGQTATAEDMNDAFSLLNMMMGQWSRRRWLIYRLEDVAFVSTGAASYTIGPGGDFNTARPDRIEAAFVRLMGGNQADRPLGIFESREDYNLVPLKSQIGYPQAVFYDPTVPLGTLYVWPLPLTGLYEIHVTLKIALPAFSNLADEVTLPNEYQEALLYNLAVRLYPMYGKGVDPTVVALAKVALNTVRNANTAIPLARMPDNLPGMGGFYNIYTDTVR